jgi:hypothetical protein
MEKQLNLYLYSNKANVPLLYQYLRESCKESIDNTFSIVLHMRDCRKGKGRRLIARKAFVWLFLSYPEKFSKYIDLIPEYGRWDDLLCLFPHKLDLNQTEYYLGKNYCVSFTYSKEGLTTHKKVQQKIILSMANQLKRDLEQKDGFISLCAKWAPSEGCKDDNAVDSLIACIGCTKTTYRKKYLTPLRRRIREEPRPLSSNPESFLFKSSLTPYEWHLLKLSLNKPTNTICVINNGRTMKEWKSTRDNPKTFTPYNMATHVGLLLASGLVSPHVISFSFEPHLYKVSTELSLTDQIKNIATMPCDSGCNIEKLVQVVKNEYPRDSSPPKKILVISDNFWFTNTKYTNIQVTKNYKPEIILWNLSTDTYHNHKDNVVYGYTPDIINAIIHEDSLQPIDMLQKIIKT